MVAAELASVSRIPSCTFCESFSTPDKAPVQDTVVAQSENFAAVVSLGAFIEGWVLVLPRSHHLNLRTVPAELHDEFESLVSVVRARLERNYGPITLFEHGPHQWASAPGCGVDHAHLHLVPFEHDLREELAAGVPGGLTWRNAATIFDSDVFCDTHYLYYETSDQRKWLASSSRIPSQLVRRILATRCGRGDKYDWREFPEIDSVQRTLEAVA